MAGEEGDTPDPPRSSRILPDLTVLPAPDSFPEEDQLGDDRPTVLITGATGNLGRKLREAWADRYSLVLVDLDAHDQPDVVEVDLATWDEDWPALFEGVDVVVHLAANPHSTSSWEEVVGPNIDATANVLNASGMSGVARVVFASSNHAMGGYMHTEGPIHEDLPPLPDGPYGASKLIGERLGRAAAAAFELEFVALRIGWVQAGINHPDTLPDDWAKKIWLSNADFVRLLTAAVEAELPAVDFLVVNGTSANRGSRWSQTRARETLGFAPRDDAFRPT